MPKPFSPTRRNPSPADVPEVVDPRWLLKAGTLVVFFAVLCVFALFWMTFYYTQWQYVLAPSRSVASTPSALGLTFTEVHFGVDATGQPQLDGWWVPADTPTSPTVLLLHDGKGSISDALPQVRTLHDVNLNVLLFDYHGFGRSGGAHPTQTLMQADAESALTYLRDTRHLEPSRILVYGNGLGASLAVNLCAAHGELLAVILSSPEGDLTTEVQRDTRTKLVPVSLLFHEDFPLAAPLSSLKTPKLIFINDASTNRPAVNKALDPKMIVTQGLTNSDIRPFLRRFLDTYAPSTLNPGS
jgi:pimeloyl-ACP methyl ester carboxylesterase